MAIHTNPRERAREVISTATVSEMMWDITRSFLLNIHPSRITRTLPPSSGSIGSRLKMPHPILTQSKSEYVTANSVDGLGPRTVGPARKIMPPNKKPAAGPARLMSRCFDGVRFRSDSQEVSPPIEYNLIDGDRP